MLKFNVFYQLSKMPNSPEVSEAQLDIAERNLDVPDNLQVDENEPHPYLCTLAEPISPPRKRGRPALYGDLTL